MAGPQRKALAYAAAFVAMLPDADVIGMYTGVPYGGMLGHRGLSHSLGFACAVGLMGAAWSRASSARLRIAVCLAAATASHGLLDALTNGGRGVAFFAPFSSERFFFPMTPIAVSPIGIAFFSARGMLVLASEIVWVWVPLLLINVVAMARTWRSRAL